MDRLTRYDSHPPGGFLRRFVESLPDTPPALTVTEEWAAVEAELAPARPWALRTLREGHLDRM